MTCAFVFFGAVLLAPVIFSVGYLMGATRTNNEWVDFMEGRRAEGEKEK